MGQNNKHTDSEGAKTLHVVTIMVYRFSNLCASYQITALKNTQIHKSDIKQSQQHSC